MKPAQPKTKTRLPAPQKLIGPAGQLVGKLRDHAAQLRDTQAAPAWKVLLYGTPGTGKTSITRAIAQALGGTGFDTETVNGRNLTIEAVRAWSDRLRYGSLFGEWRVFVIEEADLVPLMAQDLMLTVLDQLPARTAVLASSNQNMSSISDRFLSRFMSFPVPAPESTEIAAHLRATKKLPKAVADMIAVGSLGNVREAELQADGWNIGGTYNARPVQLAPVVCASGSDAAKRAWATRRNSTTAVA